MRTVAIPDHRSTPGNKGHALGRGTPHFDGHVLGIRGGDPRVRWRRHQSGEIHDFDKDFLLELEPCSAHYEMYDR